MTGSDVPQAMEQGGRGASEQRAGQQLAQQMTDTLADGVLIADAAGVVVRVNQATCASFDLTKGQLLGAQLADILLLQDRNGVTWFEHNQPYRGLATRTGVPEQAWFLPDGQEILTTARILRERPLGAVSGVAISLRSGRGRARLDRDRSDLVAAVAHELRSPLTGVKGFVQAILNRWDKLNDDQKKLMLTTVNHDADRLSRLITELLDVARIDTGRLSLYPRSSSVPVLVGRIVTSVVAGTTREVVTDLPEDLPEIFVDPDKFTQVLTNLVENGLRHGDGVVTVTARRLPPHAAYDGVLLTVDDEGVGIPVAIRQRVFTKFWKHGVRGGSGLGMYIANGLVRAHGGDIEIGDAPTGGARISLAWPAGDRRPEG